MIMKKSEAHPGYWEVLVTDDEVEFIDHQMRIWHDEKAAAIRHFHITKKDVSEE